MKRSLRAAAEYVIEAIQSLGIKILPESRLDQMYRILQAEGEIPPNHPEFSTARESIRDIRILEFALNQLGLPKNGAEMYKVIERCIADSALPEQDRGNSPGRDAQTELHVAAICANAGMAPTFVEPDIQVQHNTQAYGIAVKRLKSQQQRGFRERFKKAADQIDNANIPGYIVVDVTLAFNPNNTPIDGDVSDEQLRRAHEQARTHFVDQYWKNMKQWLCGRDVRGMFLIDHLIQYHPDDGWGLQSFTFSVNFSPDNARRTKEFKIFVKQFEEGLPTPPT